MAGESAPPGLLDAGDGHVVAWLAERQHGVVSRAQLLAAGRSRSAIDRLVAAGRVHPVHRGVYAVGHRRLTATGRLFAALLACGGAPVAGGRSALAVWDLRPHASTPEVTTDRLGRQLAGIRRRFARLPDDERTVRDGIPVTTLPRALLDAAALVPEHQLSRLVNEAEVRRLGDALSLEEIAARHPRHRGAAKARRVAAALTGGVRRTRSELEALFLAFVDRFALRRPRTNVHLHVGGCLIEVDCLWPEARLIAELDSRTTHHTCLAFESDRGRDRALVAAGFRVVRITWRQLHDEPEALARDLRAILDRPVATLPP